MCVCEFRYTGKPRRLGQRILDWDSLTASRKASLEDVVVGIPNKVIKHKLKLRHVAFHRFLNFYNRPNGSLKPKPESQKLSEKLYKYTIFSQLCTDVTLFLQAYLFCCQFSITYTNIMKQNCINYAIKWVITPAVYAISRLLIQSSHSKKQKEMRKHQNASQI